MIIRKGIQWYSPCAILFLLGLVASGGQVSAQTAVPRPPTSTPYVPPAMVINGGNVCTTQRSVALNTSIPWKGEYTNVWHYRAGESLDNIVRVPFAPMPGPTVSYTLSENYGSKTVYLDVRNADGGVISMSDSIDYKQSCLPTSPSFRDLSIRIAKSYPDRFKFDVAYSFKAARFVNDGTYQIEIRIVPDGAPSGTPPINPPITLAYNASQGLQMVQGIEYRVFHGTVTVTAPAQGELPAYGRLRFTIVSKGGPMIPERRISPGDLPPPSRIASASKVILLENHPGQSRNHDRRECTDQNWAGKIIQAYTLAGMNWVYGPSSLTLNRAPGSATAVGQTLKFDPNPLPALGERGVRWTELPTNGDLGVRYKIYWWCEGFSNKQEGSTYEFRYTVNLNYVSVRVE